MNQSVEIRGLGVALPQRSVRSWTLDERHGLPAGTIEAACGVEMRPVISGEETQVSLGGLAGRAALADAGIGPREVDLVLFAAAVGRQPIPATAPLIKRAVGITAPVPAYDVNATCLSTLVALDHAAMAISTGRAGCVLVVSSEIASSALPWATRPDVAGLFGDGAAALVVGRSEVETPGAITIGPLLLETYDEGYEACQLRAGGTALTPHGDAEAFIAGAVFEMDGKALYKVSAGRLPEFIDTVLAKEGWTRAEVDLVVPHQASPHALSHIVRKCGFSTEQVFDHVQVMGNLVAASLPVALYEARETGRLRPGSKVLMIGTSAGVSLGGMCMKVGSDGGI